jgi:hypothetical protein
MINKKLRVMILKQNKKMKIMKERKKERKKKRKKERKKKRKKKRKRMMNLVK